VFVHCFLTGSWLTATWWGAVGWSCLRGSTGYVIPPAECEGHAVRLKSTLHGMNSFHIRVKESGWK